MKSIFAPLFGSLSFVAVSMHATAAVVVDSPTTSWTAITYALPGQSDPSADHQTGIAEGDIVGDASHPSFYSTYSDGQIGWRVRLAGDSNPSGFNTNVWVGIDANLDGVIDIFVGVRSGTTNYVGIYPAGTGLNISPNTTSLNASAPFHEEAESLSNFSFTQVNATIDPNATNFDLDAGSGGGVDHIDHFLSFVLPFSQLATAINGLSLSGIGVFSENTPLQYVLATSTQDNALNQDLNGINGGIGSDTSWTDLGGFSNTFSSTGAAIPEPSTLLLSAVALLFVFKRKVR